MVTAATVASGRAGVIFFLYSSPPLFPSRRPFFVPTDFFVQPGAVSSISHKCWRTPTPSHVIALFQQLFHHRITMTELPPTYLPHFYDEFSETPLVDAKDVAADYLSKDWLTDELTEEIAAASPTSDDIKGPLNARNKAVFEGHCENLFPSGHVFASFKQLDQFADNFLQEWAISKHRMGKKIMCSYNPGSIKKSKTTGQRVTNPKKRSMKEVYQCLFISIFPTLAMIPGRMTPSHPCSTTSKSRLHVLSTHAASMWVTIEWLKRQAAPSCPNYHS